MTCSEVILSLWRLLCNSFILCCSYTIAALRGLFIIDPLGKVRSVQINDDQVGRSVEETLRLLQAFQWAEKHAGEACPASWTPGADTIKTNPYESKEYFKAHYT